MPLSRGDIGTAIRHYMEEQGSTAYVTGTVIKNAIDRTQRRLNRETEYNRADVTIALQTSVREYTISGTTTKIYRVRLGTAKTKLDPTSIAKLDKDSEGWENATAGTPTEYYCEGPVIGFVPKPHSTAAATVAYANCLRTPGNLTNATTVPTWCPGEFHDTIAKGGAIDLLGGFLATTEGAQVRTSWLYNEYLRDVQEMKQLATGRSQEYTGGFKPTGYASFRR